MKHFNKIVKSCGGTDWTEVIFKLKIREIEQHVIENIEGIEWEGRFNDCSDVDDAMDVVWEILDEVEDDSVTREIEELHSKIENEITRREEMYSYLKPYEINPHYPRFRNCQHIDNSTQRLRNLQNWLMSDPSKYIHLVDEIIDEHFRPVLREHLQAQVPDLAEKIVEV
jgi:hypothetical protein